MDKEEKIDMALAFLSPIICGNGNLLKENNSPQVIFLSATEVQAIESEGYMPTNKVYSSNQLKDLLQEIINTYYNDEENDWLEWWGTANPNADILDIDSIYDSNFYPKHPYHKLRMLKKLVY